MGKGASYGKSFKVTDVDHVISLPYVPAVSVTSKISVTAGTASSKVFFISLI